MAPQLQLLREIEQCVRRAHKKGVARFNVLNADGTPSVRCNVRFSGSLGYLVIFTWLDGEQPQAVDSLGLIALFMDPIQKQVGKTGMAATKVRSEYDGPPGGQKMWHHAYEVKPGVVANA